MGTACRLRVEDFHDDPEDPTIAIQEKGRGRSRRRIGINFVAAEALREYVKLAGITGGPLFRARTSSRGTNLADRHMSQAVMYRVLMGYLENVPGAMFEQPVVDEAGYASDEFGHTRRRRCVRTLASYAGAISAAAGVANCLAQFAGSSTSTWLAECVATRTRTSAK